jgi:hypothetical protein
MIANNYKRGSKSWRLVNLYNILVGGDTVYVATGFIRLSEDGRYFCWSHFGSSAERKSLGNLRWILKTIFQDDDYILATPYSEKVAREKYHLYVVQQQLLW